MPLPPTVPSLTLFHITVVKRRNGLRSISLSGKGGQGFMIWDFIQVSRLYDFCYNL